jgi:chorismate mutase
VGKEITPLWLPNKYPNLMPIRAIRGAIQVRDESSSALYDAVPKLLSEVFAANGMTFADGVSVLLTATPDLTSDFPAAAARSLPIGDLPLICAVEIDVPGALPRVVRVLVHVETSKSRSEIQHVYLDGAEVLRKDLAQ